MPAALMARAPCAAPCGARAPVATSAARFQRLPAVARRNVCVASSSASTSTVQALESLEDRAAYESAHTFRSYANWIIPGKVMLGRYPFIEPSRCKTRAKGEEQLLEILKEGITVFASLQDETPPQTEMSLAGTNGFLPYKATADLIMSTLQPPPPAAVVDGLRNPTLDKFLPTRRSSRSYTWDKKELAFMHRPIVDLSVPTLEQLTDLVEELEALVSDKGEKVYVHCWGGRGRAGVVGACLLAKMYGLSAEDALARVQAAYDTRMDEGRASPETDEQRDIVAAYVASIQ